jgi:hypothetical protein
LQEQETPPGEDMRKFLIAASLLQEFPSSVRVQALANLCAEFTDHRLNVGFRHRLIVLSK